MKVTSKYSKYHDTAPEGFHETEAHGRAVLRFGARPWAVRLVRKGESYGLRDCLEHTDDEPVVEFFDGKADPDRFGPLGQFVSRYFIATLTGEDKYSRTPPASQTGINLSGGVAAWTISASEMAEVMAWLAGLGLTKAAPPARDPRFSVRVLNGPSRGSDPLGGDIGADHAMFSMLSIHVAGGAIGSLMVGESQVREASTADGLLPRRGSQAKAERIRYSVKRVS